MSTSWDKNFADVMQQFEWRKGRLEPREPREPMAAVRIFTMEQRKNTAPTSKFCDVKFFPPRIKKHFEILTAKMLKETTAPVPFHVVVPLPAAAEEVLPEPLPPQSTVAVVPTEPQKRATLKLKKKVELPSIELISRVETVDKRRNPMSEKSWSELIAALDETPKKRVWNIDLAQAFKSELRAFEAEQEKHAPVQAPKLAA